MNRNPRFLNLLLEPDLPGAYSEFIVFDDTCIVVIDCSIRQSCNLDLPTENCPLSRTEKTLWLSQCHDHGRSCRSWIFLPTVYRIGLRRVEITFAIILPAGSTAAS